MKTTFFGLTSFQNTLNIQAQVLRLVEQSGFPAVMGFEFYPCVVLGDLVLSANDSARLQDFKSQGFEVFKDHLLEGLTPRVQAPGQLVIYPLVPIEKLQIPMKTFVQVLKDSTLQWLQKYKIQAKDLSVSIDVDGSLSTSEGVIAKIQVLEDQGLARGWISIHLSNEIAWNANATDSLNEHGIHLEMRPAFDEWILYFTNALLSAIPGPKILQ